MDKILKLIPKLEIDEKSIYVMDFDELLNGMIKEEESCRQAYSVLINAAKLEEKPIFVSRDLIKIHRMSIAQWNELRSIRQRLNYGVR